MEPSIKSPISLNPIETRVLGVLMEKALTQAGSYPLTINAIVLGCNQKQNREPVVEFSEGEVAEALRDLMHKELVGESPPQPGARATRFAHRVVEVLHWDRRQQAVMAELMLRGRQTAGELRIRASRIASIPDLGAIHHVLESLETGDPPYVRELPREPGRSANRYQHLLGGETFEPVATTASPDQAASNGMDNEGQTRWLDRLTRLEERVGQLEEKVEKLAESREPRLDQAPAPGLESIA